MPFNPAAVVAAAAKFMHNVFKRIFDNQQSIGRRLRTETSLSAALLIGVGCEIQSTMPKKLQSAHLTIITSGFSDYGVFQRPLCITKGCALGIWQPRCITEERCHL